MNIREWIDIVEGVVVPFKKPGARIKWEIIYTLTEEGPDSDDEDQGSDDDLKPQHLATAMAKTSEEAIEIFNRNFFHTTNSEDDDEGKDPRPLYKIVSIKPYVPNRFRDWKEEDAAELAQKGYKLERGPDGTTRQVPISSPPPYDNAS